MNVFALADLHLSFDRPKPMDVFGETWADHAARAEDNWRRIVGEEDLVLLAGDHSWAMDLKGARPDLAFIESLPGTKALVRGNHDYWWKSKRQMRQAHPSLTFLQADAARFGDVVVGGTRLWNHPSIAWGSVAARTDAKRQAVIDTLVRPKDAGFDEKDEKIWRREVGRLRMALIAMDKLAAGDDVLRVVMLHYPPLPPNRESTEVTRLLAGAGVDACVFGHVHNLDRDKVPSFDHTVDGVRYLCVSGDLVDFTPVRVR